jgi:hypothetical protein
VKNERHFKKGVLVAEGVFVLLKQTNDRELQVAGTPRASPLTPVTIPHAGDPHQGTATLNPFSAAAAPSSLVPAARDLRGISRESPGAPGTAGARPPEASGGPGGGEAAESPKTPRQRENEGCKGSPKSPSGVEPLFEGLKSMRSRDKPPLPPSTPEDSRSASLRSSAELLRPASLGSDAPGTPDFATSDEPLGHAHEVTEPAALAVPRSPEWWRRCSLPRRTNNICGLLVAECCPAIFYGAQTC